MKYLGSCHCQKIQFECEFDLKQPTVCNCSYCSKRNAVLHIVDDVQIIKGKEFLTCYRFNTMKGEHHFCSKCSIFIYSKPPVPVYPFVVNLCVLDNCDWQHMPLRHFDGKSL